MMLHTDPPTSTLVTSCIRLALLPPMLTNLDVAWAVSTPAIWISIEASLVIVCGCLPTLRLFFRHVAPRLIGESTLKRSQDPATTATAADSVSKSRLRPISELTIFKGRPSSVQAWKRMPDTESMRSPPVRSPATDASFQDFDFELPEQGITTTTTGISYYSWH